MKVEWLPGRGGDFDFKFDLVPADELVTHMTDLAAAASAPRV
jgi:hypothetical protein